MNTARSVKGQIQTANRVGNDAKDYHSKDFIGPIKVKFTLEQATKAQRVSRGIALLFL
jgi:hypothetical protein